MGRTLKVREMRIFLFTYIKVLLECGWSGHPEFVKCGYLSLLTLKLYWSANGADTQSSSNAAI